jgi:Protein of unknown function (DUF3108)
MKRMCRHWAPVVACALAMLGAAGAQAGAQGTLEARYAVSLAGISIGKGALNVQIENGRYLLRADARVVGLLKIIGRGGDGWVSARGRLLRNRPVPADYEIHVHSAHSSDLHMAFGSGAVSEISGNPAIRPPGPDQVPLTEAHRRGVLDPLSAFLVAAPGNADPVGPESCRRTVPIFDGRQRFDLTLSFKRIEQARSARGYRGPVLVCGVEYRPMAGHNPKSFSVKFLTEHHDMEVALAPIAGTRVLVPYRASLPTWYGTGTLEATEFESAISGVRTGSATDAKVQ